jgi:hypothetical protein
MGPLRLFKRWLDRKFRLALCLLAAVAAGLAWFGFYPAPVRAIPPPRKMYLPVVVGPAGPANGDFEKGRVTWSETSNHSYALILAANELPIAPHGGSWAAWLGGAISETDGLQQATRVGGSSPYLAYWRWIAAEETNCTANLARVTVNGTVVEQFGLCAANNTHGWVRRVLDLRAYADKAVTLKFAVTIGSALNGNLYLDDVAFQSSP